MKIVQRTMNELFHVSSVYSFSHVLLLVTTLLNQIQRQFHFKYIWSCFDKQNFDSEKTLTTSNLPTLFFETFANQ